MPGHKPNKSRRMSRTAYKAQGRQLKNKLRKLKKHVKKLPNDTTAVRKLKTLE